MKQSQRRSQTRSSSPSSTDAEGGPDLNVFVLEVWRRNIGGTAIRIATWNVNSIRARLDAVTAWLTGNAPDVLLLQELKGLELPTEHFAALGYESAAVTQKTYNGVATLSRLPLETLTTTLGGDTLVGGVPDSHARYLETRIATPGGRQLRVVNLYLPNGNPINTPKFDYKLAWMDRLALEMRRWLEDPTPTVIGGDWNVIPEEIDCDKPANWLRDALFQPEVRARYRALLDLGYTDAFRSLHPGQPNHFTYWDYFRMAFERNRGLRIDHFLLSPALASTLRGCEIDKTPRAQPKPSDHTPVVLHLDT